MTMQNALKLKNDKYRVLLLLIIYRLLRAINFVYIRINIVEYAYIYNKSFTTYVDI